MNRTTALPTESGFYWYRVDPEWAPEVVEWEEDMEWICHCGSELRTVSGENTGECWPEKLAPPPY